MSPDMLKTPSITMSLPASSGCRFIRLRNETSFPLADVLAVLNIPFVFVSGLSSALMPYTHRERPLFDKPYEATEVIAALESLVRPAPDAEPRTNDAPA